MSNHLPPASVRELKELACNLDVLYVEDDLGIRTQITQALKKFIKHVDTAENGLEAIQSMSDHRYDIVITDLSMPKMDGHELSRTIREQDPEQCIIVISAHAESDRLLDLIDVGVNGFLSKPLNMVRLVQLLTRVCRTIHDRKMLDFYVKMFEESDNGLHPENESAVTVAATSQKVPKRSVATISSHVKSNENGKLLDTDHEQMSAGHFFEKYPYELNKKSEELENIEDDFNMLLIRAERDLDNAVMLQLIELIRRYAYELETVPEFGKVAHHLGALAMSLTMADNPEVFRRVLPMITSLFDRLEQWRLSIFIQRSIHDIHYLDDSLISDANNIKTLASHENILLPK